jgi:hypothetical protein
MQKSILCTISEEFKELMAELYPEKYRERRERRRGGGGEQRQEIIKAVIWLTWNIITITVIKL